MYNVCGPGVLNLFRTTMSVLIYWPSLNFSSPLNDVHFFKKIQTDSVWPLLLATEFRSAALLCFTLDSIFFGPHRLSDRIVNGLVTGGFTVKDFPCKLQLHVT